MKGATMITYSFLATTIILALLPGPGSIYTISTGLSSGKLKSIYAAIGCTLGMIPHLTLGIIGISIFHAAGDSFFQGIKLAGAFYLVYLGINIFRSKGDLNLQLAPSTKGNVQIGIQAILLNLLNPKLTVFFLSFLPQFITGTGSSMYLQGFLLSLFSMLITLIIFSCYGVLAGSLREKLLKRSTTILASHRAFGIIFILLALQMALSK